MYDPYFNSARPYNKAVYKALFTDEVIKGPSIPKPVQSSSQLDQFKSKQQEKADSKKFEEQKKVESLVKSDS